MRNFRRLFFNHYSNKTEGANSMKFQDCFHCRRANSHVCRDCQNANHFLSNDTRKFYYIIFEDDPHQGPVEAYLLPYKDVQIDSYIWTEGMNQWDFAGNVLDKRLLFVNHKYCPCCNGELEWNIIYPDDRETIYKCKDCGFEFSYGATRMCSKLQGEYIRKYYNNENAKIKNRCAREDVLYRSSPTDDFQPTVYGPPVSLVNDKYTPRVSFYFPATLSLLGGKIAMRWVLLTLMLFIISALILFII